LKLKANAIFEFQKAMQLHSEARWDGKLLCRGIVIRVIRRPWKKPKNYLALKVKTVLYFETSVNIFTATCRNIPGEFTLKYWYHRHNFVHGSCDKSQRG